MYSVALNKSCQFFLYWKCLEGDHFIVPYASKNKSPWAHLQSYDVPIESSDFGNMDGEGDVVQDEWVDVVVPHIDKKILRREDELALDKAKNSPLKHLKDSFLACSQVTSV